MAIYSIEDKTLTALGDAVRNQLLGQINSPVIIGERGIDYGTAEPFQFNAAVKKVKIIGHVDWNYNGDWKHTLAISKGYYTQGYDVHQANVKVKTFPNEEPYDFEIELDGNAFTFHTNVYSNGPAAILLNYTAIGLDENGKEFKYSPTEMANKINNLITIPEEAFYISGECQYRFAFEGWDWFIKLCGNKIITENITDINHMFYYSGLDIIPFDLNLNSNSSVSLAYVFYSAKNLIELPKINNLKIPLNMSHIFEYCSKVREIPENYFDTWDLSSFNSSTSLACSNIFNGMTSLRTISPKLLEPLWTMGTSGSYVIYNNMFNSCSSLDEINGLAIQNSTLTTNRFNYAFNKCGRLKNITFQKNEDNNPKIAQWKNQEIDLSSVGTVDYEYYITDYNSGITADKKVINDETYQTLKDDPDWYSLDWAYSRYNHDSAINTINTLPNTSAYGTNIIKFKGEAGSATDGGAINTLTEEEIAVATEKGWTVSFV